MFDGKSCIGGDPDRIPRGRVDATGSRVLWLSRNEVGMVRGARICGRFESMKFVRKILLQFQPGAYWGQYNLGNTGVYRSTNINKKREGGEARTPDSIQNTGIYKADDQSEKRRRC